MSGGPLIHSRTLFAFPGEDKNFIRYLKTPYEYWFGLWRLVDPRPGRRNSNKYFLPGGFPGEHWMTSRVLRAKLGRRI